MARDLRSPRYVRWRAAVFARDGGRCRLCGSADGVNAHHIRKWSRYPALRFVLSNGITLCRAHHAAVWGREEKHAPSLSRLVRPAARGVVLGMIGLRHAQEDD